MHRESWRNTRNCEETQKRPLVRTKHGARDLAPLQSLVIFGVVASNIHWQWTPNRYIPALLSIGLGPAVTEAVERIREQWSLELIDYDHAGNNDESKDNS